MNIRKLNSAYFIINYLIIAFICFFIGFVIYYNIDTSNNTAITLERFNFLGHPVVLKYFEPHKLGYSIDLLWFIHLTWHFIYYFIMLLIIYYVINLIRPGQNNAFIRRPINYVIFVFYIIYFVLNDNTYARRVYDYVVN